MKHLFILGAGTAGTMMANHLIDRLPPGWMITVVDPSGQHLYQPGLLFLPFGDQNERKIVRPRIHTFKPGVQWIREQVRHIHHEKKVIEMEDGVRRSYDLLIIASGTNIRPDMTPGLLDGPWRESIFDFYTLNGALALRTKLENFRKGRLVVNVVEMPIKCPVAPLEFLFLADAFFKEKGIREDVELVYATPLDSAFTKPIASKLLGHYLEEKNIIMETEYMTGEVEENALVSFDERRVPFDLLVTVPTHTGADFVEDSDMGDELAFVPTDHHSLKALDMEDIFVLGDATDLPTSKAGSVAHFQAELLTENILNHLAGRPMDSFFDGHANCFVETGNGKAMLIDFNYDVQPLPGKFPFSGVGPFSLLKESRFNHWGKLAFRPIYWNALLPGRKIPLSPHMTMRGKDVPEEMRV